MSIQVPINWKEHYGVIYRITCHVDGKIYIGQSTNFPSRMTLYKTLNCKVQRHLYSALKKHGVENFDYEIIDVGTDLPILTFLEDHYMEIYDSRNREYGYNIKKAGSHGKQSEETCLKMSESQKRRFKLMSEEDKKKISERSKGKKHTEESKHKISIAKKGGKKSIETRLKMSESSKRRPPMSDEIRSKISISKKGVKKTVESIQKTAKAHTGMKRSEETRKLMKEAHTGKKQSPETVAKRIESRKRNKEAKLTSNQSSFFSFQS